MVQRDRFEIFTESIDVMGSRAACAILQLQEQRLEEGEVIFAGGVNDDTIVDCCSVGRNACFSRRAADCRYDTFNVGCG